MNPKDNEKSYEFWDRFDREKERKAE